MDTPEKAAELVSIIECNAGEPDAIVRALAPVYRQAEEAKDSCREILWYMIRAAFNVSAAHRLALDEYLAAIEQGREPSEEAIASFASREHTSKPEAEVVYGSGVLLKGADGAQVCRLDFADNEEGDRPIEFHVLDAAGVPVYSIIVRAKGGEPES